MRMIRRLFAHNLWPVSFLICAHFFYFLLREGFFCVWLSSIVISCPPKRIWSSTGRNAVWAFVVIKTATEGAVYNQSAFIICRRMVGMISKRSYDLVAMYIPFFGYLTAIMGAVSVTPLSFVYPVVFWNMKHKADAPKWRIRLNQLHPTITCGRLSFLQRESPHQGNNSMSS